MQSCQIIPFTSNSFQSFRRLALYSAGYRQSYRYNWWFWQMHSSPPWYIVASDERELEERVWKMWISIVLINVLNGCHRFVWEPTSASFAFDSLTDYGEFAILPHYPHGSLFIYALLFWMSSKMPCLALIANIQSQEIIFNWPLPRRKRSFSLEGIRRYVKSQDVASEEILSNRISTIKVLMTQWEKIGAIVDVLLIVKCQSIYSRALEIEFVS